MGERAPAAVPYGGPILPRFRSDGVERGQALLDVPRHDEGRRVLGGEDRAADGAATARARGKHSDPRAARYLVDTLDARRVAVGNAWVRDTTALDRFSVEGDRLCAVDLSVVHRLASGGVVERIESGEVVETAGIGPAGKVCVRGSRDRRYEVLTLRTRRGAEVYDPIEVHVARTPALRVRGVVRE